MPPKPSQDNHTQQSFSETQDLFGIVDEWNERHPEPLSTREILGQIALEQERSDHTQTNERLTVDELTGLQNKRGFDYELEDVLDQGFSYGDVKIFALDLDGFKSLNDRLGHDVADDALVEVGVQLSTLVSNGNGVEYFVARTGGDEFMVIQQSSGAASPTPKLLNEEKTIIEELVGVANSNVEQRENEHLEQSERRSIDLSASVGVIAPRPGQRKEEVIAEYEMALADEKTTNKLLPSVETRKLKRDELIEDDQKLDALRGLITDEDDDEKPFIDNCRRYSDAARQEVLEKLTDLPENHRRVLDAVYGDSRMPGPKILERIEFIQGRALDGYFNLSEATPEEAAELKQVYLEKSQALSNELEALLLDILAMYDEKTSLAAA